MHLRDTFKEGGGYGLPSSLCVSITNRHKFLHTNFASWLWSKSNGTGSSGHNLLCLTAQAWKLFSAQYVLQKVLLGITPFAASPNCSSDVREPNQEEVGSVLSAATVLVLSYNACSRSLVFLFPLFNDKDNFFLLVSGGSH